MQMKAPLAYEQFQCRSGNSYTSDTNSLIANVVAGDVTDMLNMGCTPNATKVRSLLLGAVLTASLTVLIANVAATNVALTVAAQPDVPRQVVFTFAPGAADVTAGIVTVVYVDQFGVTQTEVKSLITTSGVSISPKSIKAVSKLVSATISGLVGGSSPTIQCGTNTVVGLLGEVGAYGFSVFKEAFTTISANTGTGVITPVPADVATIGAVDAANGLYTLTTAPNTAKQITVWYTYL